MIDFAMTYLSILLVLIVGAFDVMLLKPDFIGKLETWVDWMFYFCVRVPVAIGISTFTFDIIVWVSFDGRPFFWAEVFSV